MYARIDAQLAALYAGLPKPDLSDVARLRAEESAATSLADATPPDAVHRIAGDGDGTDVEVFEYRGDRHPLGILVHIHGGGFVTGSVRNGHTSTWAARAARATRTTVLTVEYRLAPEHPYPAAHEDCVRVVRWAARRAMEDEKVPLLLHGQSAGGALAAGVALRLRDEGASPLAGLLLDAPVCDDRLSTPSMRGSRGGPVWTIDAAAPSWRMYLGGDADAEVSPYAAPARARSYAGLPPVLLTVNAQDSLRDEAIEMGMRMIADDVDVDIRLYARTVHGTALVGMDVEAGALINRDQFEAVSRMIARHTREADVR